MRRRQTLAAVIGVLCFGVAGCGGSAEPQPLPRPTASLSPSPSATPPVMPAAAKEKTDEGAVAFARHFVAAINYVAKSGDGHALLSLSDSACKSCKSIAQRGESTYAKGGHIEGVGWTILKANVAPRQPRSRVFVDLTIRQAPERVFASASASPQNFKGGDHTFNLVLAGTSDGWQATSLDLVG